MYVFSMENSHVFNGNENVFWMEAQPFVVLVIASIFHWISSTMEIVWTVGVAEHVISLYPQPFPWIILGCLYRITGPHL